MMSIGKHIKTRSLNRGKRRPLAGARLLAAQMDQVLRGLVKIAGNISK